MIIAVEQAEAAKAWLEKAMVEGMDSVSNGTGEVRIPVKIEAEIASSRGQG